MDIILTVSPAAQVQNSGTHLISEETAQLVKLLDTQLENYVKHSLPNIIAKY